MALRQQINSSIVAGTLRSGFCLGRITNNIKHITVPANQMPQPKPNQSERSEPAIAARPSQKKGIKAGMWTLVSSMVN